MVTWIERFSFFFQAEDGIRDDLVTGVQTCALPICCAPWKRPARRPGGEGRVCGRPRTLGAPMRYVVGIDIGGTNIVAGTVAEDGSELVGLVSEPTFPEHGPDAVLARIAKLARASMAAARGKEIAGVGIGSPGPLDTKTGVVLLTPNLGWTNYPVRDRLPPAPGLPATPGNAANSRILRAWWRGPA